MTRIYIATSNPGKLRDFAAAAQSTAILIEPLIGLKAIPPPAENEPTFEGNARTKAAYYSAFAPGELVLADDSGLEVDVLGGAPGVRSARYASDARFTVPDELDHDRLNNLYLLDRMEDVPPGRRQARYRCVLVVARDGDCLFSGEGAVEGEILIAPQGDGGFGYDPLFYLPELAMTMAQIDLATKHRVSHRGRAVRNLIAQFQRIP